MGKTCAIYGCLSSSRLDKDRHFYKFPSDKNRRKQWIQATGRPELEKKSVETLNSNFICDIHFQNSDRLTKKLKNYAIPTLNLALRENSNRSKLTQTDFHTEYVICTHYEVSQRDTGSQTDIPWVPSTSRATQTTQELSASPPRKRKLQAELSGERKKRESLKNEKK